MKKVILFVLSILSFVLLYFSFIKLTNVDNSNKALYIVSSIVLIILALFLNTHAYLNLKNKTNYIWIAISSIVIIIYNIKEHPFWSILFTIILIIVSSILIIDRETLLAYNLSVEALKDVDKMNGYEFEQFTGKLLKNIGYENVVVTPKSNDYGIDVTCNKDGKKFAIQCKCYSSKLGNSPVQEAVAGKQYYKCDVGVVLTNNYFTENAKELANANGILLWDRTELAKMLQLEKSLLQNNTPLTNQDSKETYSEYDNSNLTVSPFTGLPNLIEINDITYNIENLDDLALLPQFPDSFSYNNETLYIHTYLRRCAEGYNKNGMTDIANALYAKAEEFEKNSISNFPKTILDEIDDANKRKNQNIEETKQEKPRKHIEKFNITQEKMNRSLDNYKIPNIDLFNYTHSDNQNTIRIYDLLDTIEFISNKFNVCLGKDYDENNIYYDLIKYPHLLISGETGTGKSICMHSIIASILFETKPDEVKLLLIDPKAIEFNKYIGIPHLLVPVVNDAKKATGALGWAVSEMLQRYNKFSEIGIRDIDGYNNYALNNKDIEKMPHIVIFVDGLELLIYEYKKVVEDAICRLSAMARTVGMHLIISTQQEKIIKKANINTTIKTEIVYDDNSSASYHLLYKPSDTNKPIKIKGCFVLEEEIHKLCDFIRTQDETEYDELMQKEIEERTSNDKKAHSFNFDDSEANGYDQLFEKAAEIVIESGQASISFLQRKLSVGYAKGAILIDQLQEYGIIGPAEGSKPRKVLMTKQIWLEKRAYDKNNL